METKETARLLFGQPTRTFDAEVVGTPEAVEALMHISRFVKDGAPTEGEYSKTGLLLPRTKGEQTVFQALGYKVQVTCVRYLQSAWKCSVELLETPSKD